MFKTDGAHTQQHKYPNESEFTTLNEKFCLNTFLEHSLNQLSDIFLYI